MALSDDVGQLLWVGFPGTEVDAALRARISAGEVGAAIVFGRNVARQVDGTADLASMVALTGALHDAARAAAAPLLIAVDQEGGRVQRIREPATVWPPMLHLASFEAETGRRLAAELGAAMGRELAALGFDVDFAPVLDVHTNQANPIIGDRAFAREPDRAVDLALAFAAAMESAGVLTCGKHFPGHGDTRTDSHLELPLLPHSRERLDAVELVPFRRAAAAGVPLMMTAHIVFAAIDATRPATLSRAVVTELLRGELGYTGVIVSDDLGMKAVADHYGAADAAVAAIEAGCDALLACNEFDDQPVMYEALMRAAETSASFRDRVASAAAAVRRLKQHHIGRRKPVALSVVGCAEHRRLAARISGGPGAQ